MTALPVDARRPRLRHLALPVLAVALAAPAFALPAGPPATPAAAPTPDGRSGSYWFERGMELHGDGRWDAAIDAFRKAVEKGYREGTASFNAACAYARKGEKDRSFEWLGKAMDAGFDVFGHLDDSDLDALHDDPRWNDLRVKARASRTGRDAARSKRAADRFDLLIARTPPDGRALYDVGRELLRGGDTDRAARAFTAAAEAGVRPGTAFYNAACARALGNRKEEALGLLARALEAGYDDPDHLRKDDDLDGLRSEPRFRQLLKEADDLTLDGFPSLGARLLRSQKVAEAEEASERIEGYLKRNPGSGRAWASLGILSLAAEDDAKAARAFRKAWDLGYRRASTAYDLACAHARMRQKDEAFAWLDRAVDAGFTSFMHMEEDDDLRNVRRDPRFEKVVARAREAARGDSGGD